MTLARRRAAWREIVRPGSAHALVPVLVLVGVLAFSLAAAVVLPRPVAGPACLFVAAASLAASYLLWPKPTLLAFALLMLLSRTLSRWLEPELAQLDELVVPTLVVLAAARTRPWRNRAWLVPAREAGLALFLVMGIIGALAAGTPISVWGLGLALTAKLFAFFYVCIWHDMTLADLRQAMPVVLGLAVLVLVVGALEAVAPTTVREALNLGDLGTERESLPSIKSLLWHPGTFAWFAAFVALFMFGGYVVLRRWWLLVGGLLFAGATVLSARRRTLMALVIALASGAIASFRRHGSGDRAYRGWLGIALAGAVVAIVFLPSLVGLARLAVNELTDSGTARVALYNASTQIAADRFPLGVGFGRFGSATSKDPYSPVYAEYGLDAIDGLEPDEPTYVGDAYWAGILGETGLFGLIGLATFVGALAVGAYRGARAAYPDTLLTAFALGAWMVLVHSLVESLASAMLDTPSRTYLLFATVAAALALRRATVATDME